MRHLILPALLAPFLAPFLAPLPAHAVDLWCMPDTLCRPDGCKSTSDEEMSVRLSDPDGTAPSLRSHAETIAMTRTHAGRVVQWQGTNAQGRDEILAWRPSDRSFTYVERGPDGEWKATGLCEVQ